MKNRAGGNKKQIKILKRNLNKTTHMQICRCLIANIWIHACICSVFHFAQFAVLYKTAKSQIRKMKSVSCFSVCVKSSMILTWVGGPRRRMCFSFCDQWSPAMEDLDLLGFDVFFFIRFCFLVLVIFIQFFSKSHFKRLLNVRATQQHVSRTNRSQSYNLSQFQAASNVQLLIFILHGETRDMNERIRFLICYSRSPAFCT